MRVNKIYIWGAGLYGGKTLQDCKENGINIAGFIDSNETLWNTKKSGLVIYQPKEILQRQDAQILIAVVNETVFMEISEICGSAKIKNVTFKELKKQQVINALPDIKPIVCKNSTRYIVSLTSYGKRLKDTAPYAIITLLNQSVKPDKIILWIAYKDKENAPQIMNDLVEKGLEIRYCEDIKSYKKLVPAIENFPDDYIITADDDVYYPQNWFEQLMAEHKKNPKKIICHRAHGIKVDEYHNPNPYIEWDFGIEPKNYFVPSFVSQEQSMLRHQLESVFPTGVAGALYPPKCFHNDITNKELFMKLAPKADDIWFWAMAVINKKYFGEESPYVVIENGYSQNLQDIDIEQQKDDNALWNYNGLQGGNDKQLKAVIEQYPQIKEYLRRVKPTQAFNSENYWEERYTKGGNSGAGSYNRLAEFKAEIINEFCRKYSVKSVIEFGCGDGNQLTLAQYPKYLGFDVSETAINICKNKFLGDGTKKFSLASTFSSEKAELTLSLDVIYHLIEDSVFEKYMEMLFSASTKYVIVYASNKIGSQWTSHVKHRKFTDWIEFNKKSWNLLQFIPNKYPAKDNGDDPTTSFADFYVFGNEKVPHHTTPHHTTPHHTTPHHTTPHHTTPHH